MFPVDLRDLYLQWESREEETREVGCQWESREEETREVGCQWESREEETREVGCQWESREEETREVGCQSDSADRKEAAIQVDLLTQQHSWRHCTGVCGGALQGASIRADAPGGGALLQHCSSHIQPTLPLYLLCCPLRPLQLPTIPLSRPAPQLLQHTSSLPSMPLCNPLPPLPPANVLVPPPPPGLPAPLSHLAAEEEENKEDGVKHMTPEQIRRLRRRTVGRPIRYLAESEEQSHGRSLAYHSRVRGESFNTSMRHQEEEEKKDKDRVKSVKTEETEQIESEEQSHGLPAANHSEAGGDACEMMLQRPIEEPQEDRDDEEDDGVPHEDTEQAGPPVRYLLESEEQSHTLSAANHSRADGVKKMLLSQRREQLEEENQRGVQPVKTDQEGRPRRKAVGPPIRYLLESEERSHGPSLANHSRAGGTKHMLSRQRGKYAEEEEEEEQVVLPMKTEETEQVGEPRRKMVDPSVRGLLVSEGPSYSLPPANDSKAGEAKVKEWMRREHQVEEGPEHNHWQKTAEKKKRKQTDNLTNYVRGRVQPKVSRPHRVTCLKRKLQDDGKPQRDRHQVVVQSEERNSFPVVKSKTQRGETPQRCKKRNVKTRPAAAQIQRTRAEGGKDEAVEEGGQERRCTEEGGVKPVHSEETKKPGRLRRKMVGPPIRYLLESEERAHGPSAANRSKARVDKVKTKPERRRQEEEEGRSGGVELAEGTDGSRVELVEYGVDGRWQLCQLQLSVHREGRRLSCTKALRLHPHPAADGREEEVHATSDGANSRRAERSQEDEETFLPAPSKAPKRSRCGQIGATNLQWWFAHQATVRGGAERWRCWPERDGGRGKKRRRCREEEEDRGGKEREGRKGLEEKGTPREMKKEVMEQPQRPRRKMVGPPIRYLLESEERSHGSGTASHNRAGEFQQGRKPQQRGDGGGGALDDTTVIDWPEGTDQTDRQAGQTVSERQTGGTNQDRVNESIGKAGRLNTVMWDRIAGGGNFEVTDASDASARQRGHMVADKQVTLPVSTKAPSWLGRRKNVGRSLCWWFDYRTKMRRRRDLEQMRRRQERAGKRERKRSREEEDGEEKHICVVEGRGAEDEEASASDRIQEKEGEKKEVLVKKDIREQPQRPRRRMVGPPIRYLLESEKSHCAVTANQDRVRKPQKKCKARGGASGDISVIDRPEDTDLPVADSQAGWTNRHITGAHKRKRGRPKKVLADSENGGGASEMNVRSDVAKRQTGYVITVRQMGQMETERQTGLADTDSLKRPVHLAFFDQHSNQVTFITPCCVRLQRLPMIS